MDFVEKQRARFWKLTEQREAIDAKLDPLRAELDALVQGEAPDGSDITVKDQLAREAVIRPMIKALQDDLVPIERERAFIARGLPGGHVGERPGKTEKGE